VHGDPVQLSFDLSSSSSEPEKKSGSRATAAPLRKKAAAPAPEEKRVVVFSVLQLTRKIKGLLEGEFGTVWVRGEISNLRRQPSGHMYFTLKEEAAQLSCVMFAGDARLLRGVELRDGAEIEAAGELSVYEARGNYQLIVRHAQLCGEGVLQARFAALKRKLEAEGLFAPERKKPLPRFPRRIGVVTSPSGAAWQDFQNVLWRRNPHIDLILSPSRVQGQGAASELRDALADLLALPSAQRPEVIVLTRGGGSLEDLWEFNDEALARDIAACPLPVVSAVGHEIDFSICDFVADLRAPTPSAAAELLSTESVELQRHLARAVALMSRSLRQALSERRTQLLRARQAAFFRFPERLLREYQLELDRRAGALQECGAARFQSLAERLRRAEAVWRARHPARWIALQKESLGRHLRRLRAMGERILAPRKQHLEQKATLLRAFDPQATLSRGFTMTFDEEGRLLTRRPPAAAGKILQTRFADGELRSRTMEDYAPRDSNPEPKD
jgi:exodeoxyribonuclease VII large subunit